MNISESGQAGITIVILLALLAGVVYLLAMDTSASIDLTRWLYQIQQ